jgi:hypothetical protein
MMQRFPIRLTSDLNDDGYYDQETQEKLVHDLLDRNRAIASAIKAIIKRISTPSK